MTKFLVNFFSDYCKIQKNDPFAGRRTGIRRNRIPFAAAAVVKLNNTRYANRRKTDDSAKFLFDCSLFAGTYGIIVK